MQGPDLDRSGTTKRFTRTVVPKRIEHVQETCCPRFDNHAYTVLEMVLKWIYKQGTHDDCLFVTASLLLASANCYALVVAPAFLFHLLLRRSLPSVFNEIQSLHET